MLASNTVTILRALLIIISFECYLVVILQDRGTITSKVAETDFVATGGVTLMPGQKAMNTIYDTAKRFVIDNYPVTNEMFVGKTSDKLQSGQTYSYDKVRFVDDALKQILVFELYTDYYRMVIYHFYNSTIPSGLINRMEFHTDSGELAPEKQKSHDFGGFIK